MDTRARLLAVKNRLRLCAAELRLQPEYFQGTVLLELCAGDIATVLEELFPTADLDVYRGPLVFPHQNRLRPGDSTAV
jgi:hypothetical protein